MRKVRTIEMKRITVEEFQQAEKLPLIVVLDDVRSMYNVGSVFRTCDTFRVEAVYLCGICQTPPSTEIHKTALGAEESVSWDGTWCRGECQLAILQDSIGGCRRTEKERLYGLFCRAGGTQYQTAHVRASEGPEICCSDG